MNWFKPETSETTVQTNFFRWVNQNKDKYKVLRYMWHTPNGGKRDARTSRVLKNMGISKGIPDVISIKPFWCDDIKYIGLAIEFKYEGNNLSMEQREWQNRFMDCHFLYEVCYNSVDAINVIIRCYGLNTEPIDRKILCA